MTKSHCLEAVLGAAKVMVFQFTCDELSVIHGNVQRLQRVQDVYLLCSTRADEMSLVNKCSCQEFKQMSD